MNNLTELLNNLNEYEEVKQALMRGRTPVSVTSCTDSQKCHFVAGISEDFPVRAVITYNDIRAREIYEDLKLFDANPRIYPAKDLIFYQADIKGNALVKERIACIRELLSGRPVTVVMSIDAIVDRVLPRERIEKSVIKITAGDTVDEHELAEKLTSIGYERQSQVSVPGEFAIRGDIIDVFALNDDNPTRIELFGDSVDIIKSFDVDSQRSMENLESVMIFPAAEFVLNDDEMQDGFTKIRKEAEKQEAFLRKDMKNEEAHRLIKTVNEALEAIEYARGNAATDSFATSFYDNTVSFLDYFNDDALIVFDEPVRLTEKAETTLTEFRESMVGRLETGYILPSQADVIFDYKKVFAIASNKRLCLISTLDYGFNEIKPKNEYSVTAKNVNNYVQGIEMLVHDLENYKKKRYKTVLITGSTARAQRLSEELNEYGLNTVYTDNRERIVQNGEIVVMYGSLHKGFEYPMHRVCVLVEGDTFGAARKKNKKKFSGNGNSIHSLHELSYGDYVVHERNGLGIYKGIEQRDVNNKAQDFITIEYGDGMLYIPATGLESIQKYASSDADKKPKLNKLNSPEWKKTKERVERAVKDIAEQLVNLYAIRSTKPGYAYSPDCDMQTEFEEMFPYTETDDQLRAIADTKRDMESTKIMDRLICGDVGFGKTEIAIRAAFKAAAENKQVVLLVPTTILAQQHYNTFCQRLGKYPINVDLLCRFRTPAQQRDTLNRLVKGEVDILIGTHRILSKDVMFKDLGLLIVDEEQRFGVTHKEKIKEMKKDVDVLTLSATPIPRTLHMSLSGIRDMSVLEEAPVDRLPIQTFVMEHNDEIIREAVNRELARDGQVYYVYNRVNGIEDKAALIQKLCPDAAVAFAHGQMSERELEKIMYAFITGEIDVLVATTIIETGLDISNVNTMIIDDADKMGLSQLYQLRGRVGRSSRTSYAFLMYKKGQVLKEIAEKRLQAIREFTDLGSGFKIAMRDLEIRGAGNVLGAEQSGHMEEVGYDLYCKMLDTAIRKAKGEEVSQLEFDTTMKLSLEAYIPASYIRNETQKLDMYKRISMIETDEERDDVMDELTDRFGEVPKCVEMLLTIAQLKAMAHKVYVTVVSGAEGVFKLSFFPTAPFKLENWDGFLTAHKATVKANLICDAPYLTYALVNSGNVRDRLTGRKLEEAGLAGLKELLADMRELV